MATSTAKKSKTISFSYVKDTANTIRYEEVVPDEELPVVGTIYIKKYAAKELGNPKALTVTVAAD